MDRRSLLRTVGTAGAVLAAGCLGGDVRHEVQRSVRIQPGAFWRSELPAVEGSGAISYTVRAESRFDVYVFTSEDAIETYLGYHRGESVPNPAPRGDASLSTTAVEAQERDGYVAQTSDGGARQSYESATPSAFVIDHSGYSVGATPGDHADPLNPAVDLQVVETML